MYAVGITKERGFSSQCTPAWKTQQRRLVDRYQTNPLREAVLLTITEIPQESCLQSINAGLRPTSSYMWFTILR